MDLVTWARGRGHIIYLTLLILATTGGAYWLGFHNAATTIQLCQAVNDNRHRQVILWQYLVTAAPLPPHESAEARRQRILAEQALMVTVDRIFAPSNCQHP